VNWKIINQKDWSKINRKIEEVSPASESRIRIVIYKTLFYEPGPKCVSKASGIECAQNFVVSWSETDLPQKMKSALFVLNKTDEDFLSV
jgi:hypothetical protein